MKTSEGVVKQSIKDLLAELDPGDGTLMVWWPVVARYGARDNLDVHGVIRGVPFVIEAKAPGEKPTERQYAALKNWAAAGAAAFVISSSHPELGLRNLRAFLIQVIGHGSAGEYRRQVRDDTVESKCR